MIHRLTVDETHRVRALHEFLLERGGWEPDGRVGEDKDGFPYGFPEDIGWEYVFSFSGVLSWRVEDIEPKPIECRFECDHLEVISAGHWEGCAQHNQVEHVVSNRNGAIDFASLAALLDRLEPHAQKLDARALIECRFFGGCGPS